jgi:hypothetical protein
MRYLLIILVGLLLTSNLFAAPYFVSKKVSVTTAGTEVQVNATTLYSSHVCIKAGSTNTGLIYIGDSTVAATNGYELSPKEEVCLGSLQRKDANEAIDLSKIYVDSAVNGEFVTVLYVQGRYKGGEPSNQ